MSQHDVYMFLKAHSGCWSTSAEIADATGGTQASVSHGAGILCRWQLALREYDSANKTWRYALGPGKRWYE